MHASVRAPTGGSLTGERCCLRRLFDIFPVICKEGRGEGETVTLEWAHALALMITRDDDEEDADKVPGSRRSCVGLRVRTCNSPATFPQRLWSMKLVCIARCASYARARLCVCSNDIAVVCCCVTSSISLSLSATCSWKPLFCVGARAY